MVNKIKNNKHTHLNFLKKSELNILQNKRINPCKQTKLNRTELNQTESNNIGSVIS